MAAKRLEHTRVSTGSAPVTEESKGDTVLDTVRRLGELLKMTTDAGALPREHLVVLCTSKAERWSDSSDDETDEEKTDDEDKLRDQVASNLKCILNQSIVHRKDYADISILELLRVNGKPVLAEIDLWDMCVESGFGDLRAHKTRVDPTVRVARHLPTTFRVTGFLDNPASRMWRDLQGLVEERWDRDPHFFVRFKKLNVYPPNGFFARHVDTARPGLVGTVVLVGNVYEGGELVVHSEDDSYNIMAPGRNGMVMTVFSSAAPHQVKKVTRGTRISLVWELFHGSHPEEAMCLWPRDAPATAPKPLAMSKEALALSSIPSDKCVLLLPLGEACTIDAICNGSDGFKGGLVDLRQSLIGRDKTVAGLFSKHPDLILSVSPVVMLSRGKSIFNEQGEHLTEHTATCTLMCASSLLYNRPSVFHHLLGAQHRGEGQVKWVHPAWSLEQWAQGFVFFKNGLHGDCNTGNELDEHESILSQVYFRLVLCLMHKSNPLASGME